MATTDTTVPAAAVEPAAPAKPAGAWLGPVGLAALAAVLIAVPFFAEGFFVFQTTKILYYAISIMGLNLLTGINGQFSLGHGAFVAVGAYVTAVLVEFYGMNFIATLPICALVCFCFGFLFGFPALRLEGIYLALATFALAVATPQILKLSPLEGITGGVQGIYLFSPTFGEPPVPSWFPVQQLFGVDEFDAGTYWVYVVTLAVAAAVYWLLTNLVKSRTGRAMMAIRDNPIAARSMGVDARFYKTMAFGISAAVVGVAGGLAAASTKFVAPDSFTFFLSVSLLVGLVVGGVGWLPGAIVGGAFIVFVPNYAEEISKGLSGAFFGVFLILMIYVAPNGVGGLIRAAAGRLKRSG
ncbi:MAG: branched-chain amino acid ABC transporter permease [Pseudomonadota bacterium]